MLQLFHINHLTHPAPQRAPRKGGVLLEGSFCFTTLYQCIGYISRYTPRPAAAGHPSLEGNFLQLTTYNKLLIPGVKTGDHNVKNVLIADYIAGAEVVAYSEYLV